MYFPKHRVSTWFSGSNTTVQHSILIISIYCKGLLGFTFIHFHDCWYQRFKRSSLVKIFRKTQLRRTNIISSASFNMIGRVCGKFSYSFLVRTVQCTFYWVKKCQDCFLSNTQIFRIYSRCTASVHCWPSFQFDMLSGYCTYL